MKAIKALFKFSGGIHPAYNKDLCRDKAIKTMPLPSLLKVSMSQHLGAPATPLVKKGDEVLRGQIIGDSSGFISANVHAPTSGKVTAIEDLPTASGSISKTIAIEPDGEDKWIEGLKGIENWKDADTKTLITAVADAGVVGMGGAGFPTNVKLAPPPGKKINTLIINGAECEPYLTADHRLMVEHSQKIWDGCQIIIKILGAEKIIFAIEDNKPEAIAAMEKVMDGTDIDASIAILKTEYPQGAEKQQIFSTIGQEVPSGGLPMDVGAVVENVGTVTAVYDAVVNGLPLTERVTTVTGEVIAEPGNVMNRIGTSFQDLIDFCGGFKEPAAKVIAGGPMMGFAQPNADITTTKTTSGILSLAKGKACSYTSMPCIACGRCVDACPMKLVPSELSQFLEAEDYEGAEEINVMDCIECGCCSFACPAKRPLVQHMRQGKASVMKKRRAEQAKKD